MARGRKRKARLVAALAIGVALAGAPPAAADATKIRFTLDWIPGSVHAPFIIALQKGYFRDEGLDVSIAPGKGSAEVVRQLASGAYDIGYPDINVLMDFNAKNPGQAFPEIMMGYEEAPASIFMLKKSGITAPKQLEGRTLGAAANDATFKLFPLFAKSAGFDAAKVPVKNIEPALREALLAKGDVDAIAAQMFNAMLSLASKGVKEEQVAYFMYKDYGLELYGNGLAASRAFLKDRPDAVRGFVRASIKGFQDMAKNPAGAVEALLKFEPLLKADVEGDRLRLAMGCCIVTPTVAKDGFGGVDMKRLERTIEQIATAYDLPRRPSPAEMFDASFLPPAAERMLK